MLFRSIPLQAILFDLRAFENLLADGGRNSYESGSNDKSERVRNLLTDAAEKGQHVASIVRNLQAFARGRSDKKQLSNIPDVMEHTLELASDVLSFPSMLSFKDRTIERN